MTVDWDYRQAWVRPALANRVAFSGQSRNLVIRFARHDMTADSIRQDLDHIYNLVVVDLFCENGHIFISLNSIQHAYTARSCMYSRLKYKRIKIECWPDECAQPLPLPRPVKQPQSYVPAKLATITHRNRFEMLYNGTEDSQESTNLMEF